MPDAPKPSKASKPTSPSSGVPRPKSTLRPPAKPTPSKAKADEDEFASAPRSLPPVVVKKKKPAKKERTSEPGMPRETTPASELLVPAILIVVGLILNVVTSVILREEGESFALYVGIRMGIIVASTVITYGALFIAAAVLETDYGYITTGFVKVAAICLTQGWVFDLAELIRIPFVGGFLGWIIAFGTTYAMFKYFFGLDDMEAIASMFVVRMVHWAVVVLLFAVLIGLAMGGRSIDLPALDGGKDGDVEMNFNDPGDAGMDDPGGLDE